MPLLKQRLQQLPQSQKKVLAAHGAAKVSAYVTHRVFPKRSWEQLLHKNDDSCPVTVKAIANKAPFEVISLAGSIADAVQTRDHCLLYHLYDC